MNERDCQQDVKTAQHEIVDGEHRMPPQAVRASNADPTCRFPARVTSCYQQFRVPPPTLSPLDDRVAVAGQIRPADLDDLARQGFRAVVNNRPDGEAMFGQPSTAELRRAAEAAGLVFLDLPFSGPNATPDQVRAFRHLMATTEGPVLVYCKSGMRSAFLWGTALLAAGAPLDQVLSAALNAGQNLEPLAGVMTSLAEASR